MAKVNWKLNDVVTPDDMNLIGEEINQANIGVDELKGNDSTTDNMIGDRTVIDTAAPTANTGKLTTLLGSLAYMIKSITGKSSWRTAPATTLDAAKAHMDDTTKHITAAERTSWNAKETTTGAQTKVDAHANLTNNPHAVTKAQVGLSNVGNYGLATQAEAEAGASDAKYMTPLRTKEAIQKLVPTPTKADVGLGNVDNVKQATKTEFDAHAVDAVKHITAAERTGWNAKASTTVATSAVNGLMSAADKTKLDGVAANANNYTHPANHPASIITQDASNRFVTDAEKAAWNAKASTSVATTSASGLMSNADKSKLDGIAAGANNYTHPATHPPSIIAQDASNRFMTDAERTKLSGIATGAQVNRALATQAQAIAGMDNTTDMTPLRVREAIDSRTLYGTTAGTATALTLMLSPAPASLYAGLEVKVKLHVATGTNPTLNVNGLGAKALYDGDGVRFSGGESGKIYSFIYDGTNFILRSGGGDASGKLNVFNYDKPGTGFNGISIFANGAINNVVTDNDWWAANAFDTMLNRISITAESNILESGVASIGDYVYYTKVSGVSIFITRINRFNNTQTVVATITESFTAGRLRLHAHQTKLYLWTQNSSSTTVINIYDTISGVTSRSSTTNTAIVVNTGVAFGDDKMFFFGGTSSASRAVVYLDLIQNTWTNLGNVLSSSIYDSGAVQVGNYIYILGMGTNRTMQRMDLSNISAQTIPITTNIPGAGSSVTMFMNGGRMFIATRVGTLYVASISGTPTTINFTTYTTPIMAQFQIHGVLTNAVLLGGVSTGTTIQSILFNLTSKTYPEGTVVILRRSETGGEYYTELVGSKKITGSNSLLKITFDDVGYYIGGTLRLDISSAYGNGAQWIQFK